MRRMIRIMPVILGILIFVGSSCGTQAQVPDRIEPIDASTGTTVMNEPKAPPMSIPATAQPVKRTFREKVASLFSRSPSPTVVGVLPDGTMTMNGVPVPSSATPPSLPSSETRNGSPIRFNVASENAKAQMPRF